MPAYQGSIVEESLTDNRVLNGLIILSYKITDEDDPAERWHIYKVTVTEQDINRLADKIKPGWYMHFWQGRDVIALFHGKKFTFDYDDKASWAPAVEYGVAQGIPKKQLDFVIE